MLKSTEIIQTYSTMYLKRLLFLLGCLSFFCQKNIGQVNADFSANITSGCGSLAVSFSDLSTSTNSSIVSWEWDLGGVSVMTEQAGRIFPEGTFEICLTVTDGNGISDTECKTDYIQVFGAPIADFEVDDAAGCSPLEVTFTDLSSSTDGNIVEWIWGVGGSAGVIVDDGTMGTIQNVYDIPDDYDISLTITDDNGCVGTVTKEDFIVVSPDPQVLISADDNFQCSTPFTVNFTNENIEPNIQYTWDFGNGDTHVGGTPPPITYSDAGQYDVQVIAVNSVTGCLDTLMEEDFIAVGYPVEFTFDKTVACVGEIINFEDISGSSADDVLWDFGDGNTTDAVNPSHTFDTPGCYTISLTRNEVGCSTTIPSDICIEVKPLPNASFFLDNNKGCTIPHVANFSLAAPTAVSWEWKFGASAEMGTSTEQNPTVTFTEFGTYPIYLTVTDAQGCTNTVSVDTVSVIELDARLPDGQYKGCAPLDVTLMDASMTVAPITSWSWEINTPSGLLTSTDATPSFSIPDTGCFNVQLIVTNQLGCLDTSIISDAICVGMVPMVDFEATPLSACVNQDVSFTDLSSPFVNEWFWEFGDSTFAFSQNPKHEYINTGMFDVTLIALHHGCAAIVEKQNYIETLDPKAKFSLERLCNDPYKIEFTDKSIGAEEIFWDFGDMSTTTDVSSDGTPIYEYPDTGMYTIQLIAHNYTTGCVDTAFVDYYITDPKAEFSVNVTEGCAPLTVTVVNTSIFADEYEWISTDGDISDDDTAQPTITYDTPGTYSDIELVITDVNGCSDTIAYNGEIKVNGVTPDFIANPSFGCNPLPVSFQDNSSSLFGNVTSWMWNIGDGMMGTADQNPSFTFDTVGTFPVSLTVVDDWGCEGTLEVVDAVSVTQPLAKFKADTLGCTLTELKFLNQSHGTGLSYDWDFGDGNTSTTKHPTHEYISEGTFTICLTITDVNGCADSFCRDNYVRIANPIASFTSDTSIAACPPLIVNFENLSQNANNFEWNFGDGSGSSSLENPPHVYTIPGMFDVSLIAYSNNACRDTFTLTDYISLDGPQGEFTFEYDNQCIPTEVTFFAESNDFYTYIWDFGDGILDTSGYRMTDTISHYYSQNFDFAPNLILVDDQGCIRPIPPIDTLTLVSLEANFVSSDTALCNDNSPITFYNLSASSEPMIGVEWIFENGVPATSTDLEPVVMFNNSGTFDVTLIVDNGMCKDTVTRIDYIGVGEVPQADFVMTPTEGCAPLTVNFTDNSSVSNGMIENWNWDFGSSMSSIQKNPEQIFTGDGVMEIKLRVTTNEGCQDSTSQLLTVFPEAEIEITNDSTICQGEIVELSAEILSDTTGLIWFWKPSPTISCTDCMNPTVNPMDTTTYTFVVQTPENCEFEKEVTINVRPEPVPVVTISNDTTICAGDETQIFAGGGDDIFGYNWDQSAEGLSCYNSCVNPIATPASNTTYTVTVTNVSGCSSVDSVTVDVFYEFQDIVGEDRIICRGDTAQLNIQTGNNPVWMVANGLSCSQCPDPIAKPITTTTYIVRVETDFGCMIYDSITIKVLSADDIDAGDDIEICVGQTAQLTGFGDGIPKWSPAATLNDTSILNPIASPEVNTMYYFSLENGDCILTDSMEVKIKEKTEISLLDQDFCEGEALLLQPIGFADDFQWSPPEGLSQTDIENPLATPSETTEYTVIATLGTCPPDTASAVVTVLEKPQVRVPSVFQFFPGESVDLEIQNNSTGDYSYQWTPGIGLSCTDCQNPTATVDSMMNYIVIVTDLLTGCSSSHDVNVRRVDECHEDLISMPNAFSPNGDGKNDTYHAYSGVIDEIEYFRVFNRWGAVVYESTDRYFAWDGKFKGKKLPEGIYIYVLGGKCKLDGGSTIIKKGDIFLHY